MRKADRALSLVDVLAAGPARTKRIDLAFAQQVFVRFRQQDHVRLLIRRLHRLRRKRNQLDLCWSLVCFSRSGVEAYNQDMLNSEYIRAAAVTSAFAALVLSSGAAPQRT